MQKNVLITGASSGIGEAIAREFFKQGATLALLARRIERLKSIQKDLDPEGNRVQTYQTDVTSLEDLKNAAKSSASSFGKIDVVIANAGFGVAGNLDSLTPQDYRRQFEVNVFGVLNTIYATLDELKKSKGILVLIGSVNGYIPLPGVSAYGMSKAAITALHESIRPELAAHGVSCVLISPGFVESEIRQVDNLGVHQPGAKEPVPEWLRMPARVAASQIVKAVLKRKNEEIITNHGKLAVFLKRHFSWLIRLIIEKANIRGRRQPKKT